MSFARYMILDGALQRAARAGDSAQQPIVSLSTTDANRTITISDLAGGVYARSGLSVGRSDTTPTAAQILAAAGFANMDIGDSYRFTISNRSAQTLTILGGTGVTVTGTATVSATTSRDFLLVRTGTATFDCVGL
jgi:hypothetical protein